MSYSKNRLLELSEIYLATLDNKNRDEWYATVRGIHEEGVEGFIDFIESMKNGNLKCDKCHKNKSDVKLRGSDILCDICWRGYNEV